MSDLIDQLSIAAVFAEDAPNSDAQTMREAIDRILYLENELDKAQKRIFHLEFELGMHPPPRQGKYISVWELLKENDPER